MQLLLSDFSNEGDELSSSIHEIIILSESTLCFFILTFWLIFVGVREEVSEGTSGVSVLY